MQSITGMPNIDNFRNIALKIIEKKDIMRRNDFMTAAKAANVKVTSTLFNKVIKSLCVPKDGHNWVLKNCINSN